MVTLMLLLKICEKPNTFPRMSLLGSRHWSSVNLTVLQSTSIGSIPYCFQGQKSKKTTKHESLESDPNIDQSRNILVVVPLYFAVSSHYCGLLALEGPT